MDNITLPLWLGKTYIIRLVRLYSLTWEQKYGIPSSVGLGGKECKLIKGWVAQYGEYMTALIILIHFTWKGASGTDEFANKKLEESCYPLSWISNNIDAYRAYIKNKLSVETQEQAKEYVDRFIDKVLKKTGSAK